MTVAGSSAAGNVKVNLSPQAGAVALGADAAPVGLHDALAYRQPQARPVHAGGRAHVVAPGELAEQLRQQLRRYPPALV